MAVPCCPHGDCGVSPPWRWRILALAFILALALMKVRFLSKPPQGRLASGAIRQDRKRGLSPQDEPYSESSRRGLGNSGLYST